MMLFRNKKGKIEWEYILAFLIVLIVAIVALLMIDAIRNQVFQNVGGAWSKVLDFVGL